MTPCSETDRAVATRPDRGAAGTRVRRLRQLAIGGLALAALAVVLSQAGRFPGPLGEVLRANLAADRDATALFYTEVKGWRAWRDPQAR